MISDPLSKIIPLPLLAELTRLREDIIREGNDFISHSPVVSVNAGHQKSTNNLSHYIALRHHDMRRLQDKLAALGLSSLGRCEGHVLATLNQVISLLSTTQNRSDTRQLPADVPDFADGSTFLEDNSRSLFGEAPAHRYARIMVTLPTEAATDRDLVMALLASGMNIARINCAHDTPEVWGGMIGNIRSSAKALGVQCKIMMDLAGQKIRTGAIAQRPGVMRIRIRRNSYGDIVRPTFLVLYPAERFPAGQASFEESYRHAIPVAEELFQQFQVQDRILFKDARGKHRQLTLHAQQHQDSWLASTEQSIYLVEGTKFQLQRKGKKWHTISQCTIAHMDTQDVVIRLHEGETLRLTYDQGSALAAELDRNGKLLRPAQISCSQPEALNQVQLGQTVWIDDGKLGAIVAAKDSSGLLLTVTHAPKRGMRLKSDKGINFPNTNLALPCLTMKDRRDLDFICQHADVVGLSFVQKAEDIRTLMSELDNRNAQHLGVVAKIETKQGIKNLPEVILSGLRKNGFGVMIARGDLAVELGGERLAEMQEEILWLCESAHVPVIWATQVLETLTKNGIQTRPEFTDAAMSGRAECVMLNKGPFVVRAVRALDSILGRMEEHQHKKGARLRALSQWY